MNPQWPCDSSALIFDSPQGNIILLIQRAPDCACANRQLIRNWIKSSQRSPTKHKAKRPTGQGQRSVNMDAPHCKRHEKSREAPTPQSDYSPSIVQSFLFHCSDIKPQICRTFSTAGTSIHITPTPIRLTRSRTQLCWQKLLSEMFEVRLQDRLHRKLLQGFQWLESTLSCRCLIHVSCTHLAT